jgi:hypothetical protein
MTDQQILDALLEAKANGATGVITDPETAEAIEHAVELNTFTLFTPNRTQRRAMGRVVGQTYKAASNAAARRRTRRRTARRSTARNRA